MPNTFDFPDYLAFGIPSLDRHMGSREDADLFPEEKRTDAADEKMPAADASAVGLSLRALDPTLTDSKSQELDSASICVIGPDGTGKSLFALHLASEHWRRCSIWWSQPRPEGSASIPPKIIYASSDLSVEMARKMWRSFWLDRPYSRKLRIPFEGDSWRRPEEELAPEEAKEFENRLQLEPYKPQDKENLAAFIDGDCFCPRKFVGFIDLESHTSGDDWSFLNRLLSGLPEPKPGDPLHMMVVDAVEGLETLVGERDAFGELQGRRARVAQLVRAAAGKCHLIFVVEEPKHDERLPEVFIADVVLRLRNILDGDYSRRTMEFEKVRGQKHTRGQHDFRLRGPVTPPKGKSSVDPSVYTPDFPEVGRRRKGNDPATLEFMSYIQVFASLHQLSRLTEEADDVPETKSRRGPFAAFGIYNLDSILGTLPSGPSRASEKQAASLPSEKRIALPNEPGIDERGLPVGSVTTLIGHESTYKSQLARAFLAMAFKTRHVARGEERQSVRKANEDDPLLGQGAAILLTTSDYSLPELRRKLRSHLIPETEVRSSELCGPHHEDGLTNRLILRHLEPHHLTSSLLMHMIQQLVTEAQRRLRNEFRDWATKRIRQKYKNPETLPEEANDELKKIEKLAVNRSRIRLVIDDWSVILSTFPEVAHDSKFLPFMIRYLRREGVTSLILANYQGNPADEVLQSRDKHIYELRSLADCHLYTWHVSFFDERRVAITMLPTLQMGVGQQVRELRPARFSEFPHHSPNEVDTEASAPQEPRRHPLLREADRDAVYHDEALAVDPHFELYTDLEKGKPLPVPLRVYLYAEKEHIPSFQGYLIEITNLFKQIFGQGNEHIVLHPQYGVSYDTLREFSYLQSETRLDHTLVLQVDEFWAESRSELRRQERYLNARTVDYNDLPLRGEDPFALFQLSEELKKRRGSSGKDRGRYAGPLERRDFFDTLGYDLRKAELRYPIYKIPFTWDFGFLVCNRYAWEKFQHIRDHRTETVYQVMRLSSESSDQLNEETRQNAERRGFVVGRRKIMDIWRRLWKIDCDWHPLENPPSPYSIESIDSMEILQSQVENEAADSIDSANNRESLPEGKEAKSIKKPRAWFPFINVDFEWEYSPESDRAPTKFVMMNRQPIYAVPETDDKAAPVPPSDPVSWREFFGACASIARNSQFQHAAFDVDLMAAESLSCLVFEVWMSEVYQAHKTAADRIEYYQGKVPEARQAELKKFKEFLDTLRDPNKRYWPRPNRHDDTSICLSGMLDNSASRDEVPRRIATTFRRALYRTVLLLNEMLDISRMSESDNIVKPKSANPEAVAARHWYSTATAMMRETDPRGKVVVGLPGHYTVRGDWFLAVARGSRSPRLGERAMDILCSKRGNITRLQHGLGLPVRDLFGFKADAGAEPPQQQRRIEYWTSLPFVEADGTEYSIEYKQLRALGAKNDASCNDRPQGDRSIADEFGRDEFHWFWRSSIESYDTHARVWQRWLCLLLREWRNTWPKPIVPRQANEFVSESARGLPWWDGFKEYDYYRSEEMNPDAPDFDRCCFVDETCPRWKFFERCVDGLIETLGRANYRKHE